MEPVAWAPKSRIRVLIASTLSVPAAALAHLVNSDPGLEVVGNVPQESPPGGMSEAPIADVLLVEFESRRREILRIVDALQKQILGLRTIAIIRDADSQALRMLLQSHVRGFVLKSAETAVLLDSIRAVYLGRRYLDAGLSDAVMDLIEHGATSGRNVALTNREQQVLGLIANGQTYKEIANALSVSVKTIETYRTRLGEKLQLRTRRALVDFAVSNDYLA